MASKYDSRRIWMNTGASAKLKNLALEEATVRRTKKIYQQATRDIEAQVGQIYSQLGVLARNNRWEFPGLNNPATKKDMSALIKAVNKAGLTDYVPEKLTKRMNVIQVKQMNIWLKIQEAGQQSHEATKEALLKTMQNSGKAWAGALAADADSFVGFDRNICGYMMGMNWEDGNFSSRLWNASNETWEKVRDELTRAMANGQQPETTKAHLRRILSEAHNPEARGSGGISYDVERIIRTESAKAATQADLARWREAGVDKVQWHATFEKGTCVHCADRDGRIYKLEEAMLDEPPLHPNCKCYFAAYDEVAAKFPDTTYYKNDDGDYTEIQWAPYHSVINSAGQLRSEALKVSDYFWKTSPWTTYKSPKTGISYKGELDNQVKDMTERTIQALSDQYPEIRERLKETYDDEITLHRGSSVIIGNKLDEIGGLADPAYHQLTIAYLDKATGGNPLSQMAAQAKNQFKKDFWSTPKDNHTIVHELGHVLANDLKSTRGIDAEQIILKATGKKNWKQAKAVLEGDISRYAAKNPEEAFAELFARAASQDVALQNKTTARFADALEEARKQPKKRVELQITDLSKATAKEEPLLTGHKEWWEALTAEEREAVKHYQSGYDDIRRMAKGDLEKLKELGWEKEVKETEALKSAIDKFTIQGDRTVWRGVRADGRHDEKGYEFVKKLKNDLVPGDTFTDYGFSSTSLDRGIAEGRIFNYDGRRQDESVLLKIHVPEGKGVGAVLFETGSKATYADEQELLLNAETKFKVISKETVRISDQYSQPPRYRKATQLEVEVIPKPEQKLSAISAQEAPTRTYTTESGWLNSLTRAEREALNDYTRYYEANDYLRDGKYKKGYKAPVKKSNELGSYKTAKDLAREKMSKQIDDIDAAIGKFTLTSDKTVWRGLSESQMSADFQKKLDSLKPGSILTDKAYSSTAVTKDGTREFANDYLLKIKVPAGTGRGIYTRKLSEYEKENEFLIKRDAQFMVTKVGTTTNAYGDKVKLIEVEMQVPENPKTTKPAAIKMSGTETKELTDNQIIELAYDDLRQNYDTRDVMYRIAKERKIDGTPKVVTDEEFKALDEKEYTKYTRGITDDNFRGITKEQVHEQTMRGNYRVSESFRSTIGQGYYITEKADKSRYFAELGLLQGESGAVEEIALPKTMQMLDLRKETDRKKLEKMEKEVTELNDRIAARYKKVDFTSNDPEASKQAHYLNVYEYAAAKGYDGIIGSDEEAVLFNRADAIINKELKDEKKPKNWRTAAPQKDEDALFEEFITSDLDDFIDKYDPATAKKMMDLLEEEETGTKLTDKEKEALDVYAGGTETKKRWGFPEDAEAYQEINTYHRTGEALIAGDEEVEEVSKYLDAALEKNTLAEKTTVYRGIDEEFMPGADEIKPGETFTEYGYMSTTRDKSVAEQYPVGGGAGTILEIELPAGAHAVDLNQYDTGDDDEILLPRNTKLKILKVEKSGKTKIIKAKLA